MILPQLQVGENYLFNFGPNLLQILSFKRAMNFYPLEVVGRGSETQLQVGKNKLHNVSFYVLPDMMLPRHPLTPRQLRMPAPQYVSIDLAVLIMFKSIRKLPDYFLFLIELPLL